MLNEWSLTLTKLCSSKDHYPRESGNENNEIFISKCEFQTWCTKRQHILLSQISKFSCKNVGFEIVCSYYHLVSLLEQCQKIVQYLVFSWVYPRTFVLWVAYPKFKCLFPRSKKKKRMYQITKRPTIKSFEKYRFLILCLSLLQSPCVALGSQLIGMCPKSEPPNMVPSISETLFKYL